MMNKQSILDLGRKAAEVGVERVLALGETVESMARQAADQYNRIAGQAPIALPKIPLARESDSSAEAADGAPGSAGLPQEGPVEVSTASIAVEPAVQARKTAAAAPKGAAAKATETKAAKTKATKDKATKDKATKTKAMSATGAASDKIPGRTVLRRWKRTDVVDLAGKHGVEVATDETKASIIARLHGDANDAVKSKRRGGNRSGRLPQRPTLMKRNRDFIESLCTARGLAVRAKATKRELIDALYADAGVEG